MCGGDGPPLGEYFFGILHDGRLYFKTDETTREKYRNRGMGPFAPSEKQVLKSYYEVPEEIVEDDEELASWAREAAALKKKGKAAGQEKEVKGPVVRCAANGHRLCGTPSFSDGPGRPSAYSHHPCLRTPAAPTGRS